jgi:hypothetical protein
LRDWEQEIYDEHGIQLVIDKKYKSYNYRRRKGEEEKEKRWLAFIHLRGKRVIERSMSGEGGAAGGRLKD